MYVDGVYLSMKVKREPSTLEAGVIAPGITISFLSLLYIFIQRDNTQRQGYLTTVLLTEVMFLVMMTNFVPTARENPSFQFLFFNLALVQFCCIVFSVFIMWLTRMSKKGKFEFRSAEGGHEEESKGSGKGL